MRSSATGWSSSASLIRVARGRWGPCRSPGSFLGTVIAGAGFGAGFQGGLRAIVTLADPAERGAGVISVAYIICYLAMGLPAILAGVLVVHSTVTRTAQEFGITVIALAAITAVGTILNARRTARQQCLSPTRA